MACHPKLRDVRWSSYAKASEDYHPPLLRGEGWWAVQGSNL